MGYAVRLSRHEIARYHEQGYLVPDFRIPPQKLEHIRDAFHDVYMIHGSRANNTTKRRAAFVVRIMPGNCFYDHALGEQMAEPHQAHDYGRRPLFLIRGRDRTGKNNFHIGH